MSSTAAALPSIQAAGLCRSKGALVVSIHDVASSTREISEKMISEIARRGVNCCSLLVVPNYHHTGSITDDRELGIWLRELEGRGHEIVIHGYFHERPRRRDENLRDRFITRFYTNDEGEFYDLEYNEALRRVEKAREDFAAVGVSPRGFIAPAWLLNAEGERAATDAGMEYTTRLRAIRDLRSGRDFPSRSLVYSVRSPWRRTTSLGFNAALFFLAERWPLLRLSVHPPDYQHAKIWKQILGFIDRLLDGRVATTYANWIDEQRAQASQN